MKVDKNALTLVELLVGVALLSMLFIAVAPMMNIGEISTSRDLEKIRLHADLRQLIHQITRDVRQTTAQEINNNSPTTSHIRFRIYTDYNATSQTPVWSSGYIEYNYTSGNQTLIRSDGNTNITMPYNYITNAPFVITSLSNSTLVVNMSAQRSFRNSNVTSNLTTEIKIRNQ